MSKVSVTTITDVRHADWNHDVVTVRGGSGAHCKRPCKRCPWRRDTVGVFPAEAFRHSAHTAYDMSDRTFGCHARGTEKPAVCAGFLMVGAEHNLKVRLQRMKGEWTDASDGGHELFDSYRAMAEANGVPSDDPVLERCRSMRD